METHFTSDNDQANERGSKWESLELKKNCPKANMLNGRRRPNIYSDEEKEPLLQKESLSSMFYFIYDLLWLLILSNVYLVSVCWFSYIIVYWYSISGTFRDYLIFTFFGTSFRSQNIRNTQIIYPLWYYVNLFKWEKMTDTIKKI